ncbi:alpha-L-rhamnosidase [Caldanaerobius fijiensis DSM 17918]|uniref:alpha-L-rhamnosidase n=1 Tax=Caldanaerobius fijiensis DSM 17918 TaxID=1121256 RepID=A0A1M5A0A1_9THEO|nr:glycoside hydrolase family 78 protein [Caldanaerobius fijiensis]SHF23644.1 alpha-L-rhamnosidase [Caldanaerobius fijiensis DSM 17918]
MDTKLTVGKLRCNYLYNPLGVETPNPRLSWALLSQERGQRQTAYRVLVASEKELLNKDIGDMWDSGIVETDQSIHVVYKGRELKSRQRCYWKVKVWDMDGKPSAWSEIAYWEMGLLNQSDWYGQWIAAPHTGNMEPSPAPLFRRVVSLEKKVASARAYVCGLGYYELYINGRKIGDDVLKPAFTRYDETVLYNTYDVTDAFRPGENVIGVILGNGWYNCFTKEVWNFEQAPWRDKPKLMLQVIVQYDDGSESVITTDRQWRVSTGPIVFDGLRNGEFYDARLEKQGWNDVGYDDSEWENAVIVPGPGGVLKSQQMTPIRITDTIVPKSVKEVKPGVFVYDLGQNISGWAQIKVSGPAGTTVTMKYAEKLKDDGDIDTSNIDVFVKSGEFQTDKYTLKGEGIEVWEPRFTYHGFQYVQVTGFPGRPTLDNLRGRVVHTDFEAQGEFKCSNELLNSIQHAARWATLSNYMGIPTDCPHREKNGWTGDAQLSAEQVLMNFDPMTAYTKWMSDFQDVQRKTGQLPGIVPTGGWGYNWGSGPAWDSAIIFIPWYMYLYCGDEAILEKMYDNMKKYVDFMTTMATDDILEFGLGDWCPPTGGPEGHKCPVAVTSTAYYYVDTHILSKVASILGKKEDAERYAQLARRIRDAFRKKFFDPDTGQVLSNSQTSLSCALYQGLVNEDEKQKVLALLVEQVEKANRHIDCGILGAKYIMHTLTELGRADLAYDIATQTTFPGWGYWIAQGATTLWETWSGDASRNHHMFSDISAWFYKGLAGINPDPEVPGFKNIIFKPNPVGDLQWVKAWHESMYGKITCNWAVEGNNFNMHVIIPPNSTGTVYIPTSDPESVMENGEPVSKQVGIQVKGYQDGRVVLLLQSGEYHFSSRL